MIQNTPDFIAITVEDRLRCQPQHKYIYQALSYFLTLEYTDPTPGVDFGRAIYDYIQSLVEARKYR
jgi:hypothetical protein